MIDNLVALRARDDLLAVAASWGALRARLRPAGGTSDGVHTAPGSRPPIDLGVSDLLAEIEQHARFLGQVLLEETTDFEPTTSTMPGLLEDVARRYGHFAGPDADERLALDFCDEAHELRRKVSGAIARHEPARWQGPCPEDECVGELYQRPGWVDARCRECGRVVGAVEWRAIMHDAFEERLMTRSELISALVVVKRAVKPNTLDRWVSRGRLAPEVTEPDLFKFAHAYALAERYDVTKHERISA